MYQSNFDEHVKPVLKKILLVFVLIIIALLVGQMIGFAIGGRIHLPFSCLAHGVILLISCSSMR